MEAATQAKIPKTYRLPQVLVEAIERRHEATGRDRTELVTESLSNDFLASEKGSKDGDDSRGSADHESAPPHQGPSQAPQDEINLTTLLHRETGHPRSLCRLFISQGRVAIDGEVVQDPFISGSTQGEVSLDGEPVKGS